jgi:hypothetical protein
MNCLHLIVGLTCLLLVACGGGGNSSSAPQIPVNPPVTPVGLISSEKAEVLIAYPISVVESIYQVGQLINPRIKLNLLSVDGSVTNSCEQSGEYTVSHTDTDDSNNVSPSDTLLLSFSECVPDFTSQALNGTANINVLNTSIEISGYSVNLALSARDADGVIQLSTESINIETIEDDSFTQTTFRTVQNPFIVGIEGLQETFSSLDLVYSYSQDTLRYTVDFDFSVNSQIIDLDFRCETTLALSGLVFQLPSDYDFRCVASVNDVISVVKDRGENSSRYQYTSAGASSGIIGFTDTDFYEGSIAFPLGVKPETEFATSVLAITLNASNSPNQEAPKPEDISNILYDDNTQTAYVFSHVFNSSPDGVGSVVQKINVADMTLINSKRIIDDDWITRSELSQNGDFLYAFAATQGQKLVYVISTTDLSIVDTINLDLYSTVSSIATDSVYIESFVASENEWIVSYSKFGSNENEFLVFDGSVLTSRGIISGQYNANVLHSQIDGTFVALSINGFNTRNLSVSRYFLDTDNTWTQISFGEVTDAELGSNAPNGQFSMPVLELSNDYIITEYGYVFSLTTFELITKLNIDRPALSTTSGIIFEQQDNGINNLYDLFTLELQRRNFLYETPFSRSPWSVYKGTEELFFYGSIDQVIRVGVLLID